MSTIADNIHKIRAQITELSQRYGRSANDIQLLAVSKTKPASAVESAFAAGQRDFGENYLQDALDKIDTLKHLRDIKWHFIGPIQSNKTKAIAENFDWVHSVDRLKIAQRLSDQRPDDLPPLQICLQVNISQEESKSGVNPDDVPELAQALQKLPNITLRGLMAIPKATTDKQEQHQAFQALAVLLQQLQEQQPEHNLDTLSMGMSGDMEAAIAEGATWVRIGTGIFGARPPLAKKK